MNRLLTLLLLFAALCSWSADYELSDLDFTNAEASFAGANRIYVKSVKAGDQNLSLLIRIESADTWVVEKISAQEDGHWPADLVLNFIEIRLPDENSLVLSGLLTNGRFYTATFEFDGADRLVLEGTLKESGLPADLQERADSLKTALVEQEKQQFEQEKDVLLKSIKSLAQEKEDLEGRLQEKTGLGYAAPAVDGAAETDTSPADARMGEMGEQPSRVVLDFDSLAEIKPSLTKILLQGFDSGVPSSGAWKISSNTAEQFDAAQYFAKMVFPVLQTKNPTLFSFSAKASGKGWVGLGLHIYVTDARVKTGYGLGKSLLVWLTRDPETYGNDNTYIQLYSSTDAVTMKRVLNAVIPEPISDYNRIEVLYEPDTEYIVIAVNGVEKIRYKTWFSVSTGVEIALRTLKADVVFRDLMVGTTD